jgi:hypothetical protein
MKRPYNHVLNSLLAILVFTIILQGGGVMDASDFSNSAAAATGQAVTMQLIPEKTSYGTDRIPDFTVIIRNSGAAPVKFCMYMLEYRLKSAMYAENAENSAGFSFLPFKPVKWEPLKADEFKSFAAGEEMKISLKLSADPDFGFVPNYSQPPVIPPTHRLKGFPAGRYGFRTILFHQMALYIGASGVHDFRLEQKLLRDLPGGSDAFLERIEGKCTLIFQ